MSTTIAGLDGKLRCSWCVGAPEFLPYHDTEWGFPVSDDQRLFEKLCLEGFQSGLSWRTILNKRDNFRAAFHGFDFNRVARFTQRDVNRLLKDAGIVRHREGSLAAFIWRYEPDPSQHAQPQLASTSAASIALSKDLKKMGWQFVGPTTVHAFLQAMGLINDHAEGCVIRAQVARARKAFNQPTK
jgi:DNA-3-methyladenine glycosylase I